MTDKKIKLKLVGLDGNAFVLLAAFQRQAEKEGWTQEDIDEVLTEAKSGDYAHLTTVLSDHCRKGGH